MIKTKAIKFYMREAGFHSQRQLADFVKVTKEHLNRVVNNTGPRPSLDLIDSLCTALKVQPGEILEHKGDL